MSARWRSLLWRAAKFYGVGAGGTLVQLLSLVVLREAFGVGYLAATAFAVEISVLHNFAWHERFTWRDRRSRSARQVALRLARFNLTTGALSILGNLVIMRLLVGGAMLPYLLANAIAIAACGLANFAISERWVFHRHASELQFCQHAGGQP